MKKDSYNGISEPSHSSKTRKIPLPPWAEKYESETRSVYPQERNGKLFYGLFEKQQGGPRIYVGSITEAGGLKPVKRREAVKEQNPPVIFDPFTSYPSSDSDVYEFGFSRSMIVLGEPIFRKHYPDNFMDIATALILEYSPNSYLKMNPKATSVCACGILERKLNQALPVCINELKRMLSSVSLIVRDGEAVMSRMSDEQKEFCQKYNLQIGE